MKQAKLTFNLSSAIAAMLASFIWALTLPVGAQTPAQLDAVLDRVFLPLKALPFPKCGDTSWSSAVDALRNGLSTNAGGWRSSSNTCGLQLYVEQIPAVGIPSDIAVYVIFDKGLKISDIPNLKGNKWKNIADATLTRPIFSITSVERTLNVTDSAMPASLRSLFGAGSKYAGLQQFTVPIGPQLFTHAAIKGTVGKFLKDALNAPVDNLWIRAGFASESPSDLLNREGAKFLEILMPPGTTLSGPLGMTEARVSDATITVDDAKNVSLMGNISFQNVKGKVFPTVIDLPATPAGSIDWTKAQMALSTPSVITLEEFARVAMTLNAQAATGGLSGIGPAKSVMDKIATMFKPLSTFKVTNPNSNADSFRLKAGSEYPDMKQFNIVVLSKEAKAKDDSGDKGPIIRLKGGMSVFGQQLARTNTDFSESGLYTDTKASFNIDLTKMGLGKPGMDASAKIRISQSEQLIQIAGPIPVLPDRRMEFNFDPSEISIHSASTCTTPVDIHGKLVLDRAPNMDAVLSALSAVQPDPKKLVNCAEAVYYLVSDGVVYVFNGSKQLMSMAASAFPADQIAKFGSKGLKMVGGAFVDAGDEALNVGKKIGGAVGGAATKVAGTVGGTVVDAAKASEEAAKAAAKASADAAQAASRAAEAAATAAANAAANAAHAAANAAANAARAFVSNPAKAVMSIGHIAGGGDKKTCNQRIEWLRARGNVPNPAETDAIINGIYLPLLTKKEEARAIADHIQTQAGKLSQAHESFRAMEQHWNSKVAAIFKVNTLDSFHAGETHIFDYQARINQMRANADYLDKGDNEFGALLGWKKFAGFESPSGWRGQNEGEWLWARCAAAWTADIPIRTAQAWGIHVPLHKGKFSDAMFMGRQDYMDLRTAVTNRINEKGVYTQQQLDWLKNFMQKWARHSMQFQSTLVNKMDESVGALAGQLRVKPPTTPPSQAAWKEYLDSVAAYRSQTEAMASLNNLPNQQQAAQTIDRVLRATDALKKSNSNH